MLKSCSIKYAEPGWSDIAWHSEAARHIALSLHREVCFAAVYNLLILSSNSISEFLQMKTQNSRHNNAVVPNPTCLVVAVAIHHMYYEEYGGKNGSWGGVGPAEVDGFADISMFSTIHIRRCWFICTLQLLLYICLSATRHWGYNRLSLSKFTRLVKTYPGRPASWRISAIHSRAVQNSITSVGKVGILYWKYEGNICEFHHGENISPGSSVYNILNYLACMVHV